MDQMIMDDVIMDSMMMGDDGGMGGGDMMADALIVDEMFMLQQ